MPEENTIRYWKISPGEHAKLWDACRKNNLICLGWSHDTNWKKTKFGDMASKPNKELIKNVLREEYLHKHTERQISSWADIIKDFFDIKPSHKVIVYDKVYHINALAEVIGEYEFNKKIEYPHTKAVEWIKIFDPPYNIRPFEDELVKKISRNRTVVEITKNDWDIIYAKAVGSLPTPPQIDNGHVTNGSIEDQEESGLTYKEKEKLRFHKSFERNPKLIREAKKFHRYTCMACGFNYEEKYGEIGEDYIEAHHLIPFAELDENTDLSPKNDVVVLCANCHRMIHRFEDTSNITKFKKLIQ